MRAGEPGVMIWRPIANREDRGLLQERLSLFARSMFWIFSILVALVAGLFEVWPSIRPPRVALVFQVAIVVLAVSGLVWLVALRRGRPSLAILHAIDLGYLMLAGATLGASGYFQSELPAAPYAAMLSQLVLVFTRAIIVPSTGRRTAAVSALSFVVMLGFAFAIVVVAPERLDMPAPAMLIGACFYATVATLVAASGSRIIYGLRRQVRAAMQLGQYTLEHKIGEGGMGAVYRAHHALLRRPTAIKLVPPDKVRTESLRRFEREVQNMSVLTHPNTVAIYDYGIADGVFYYAMEYIDGIDLDALVRRDGPLPAARVVHVLYQICGALDEAHALGLTHRDIKPANIILCRRGRKPDVVKVVDFGLVKEIRHPSDDASARGILGTPAYISPEAITDPDRVGPRSDLYSLGALAYYLLTARHVFEGHTPVEVCLHHVSTTPAPPSQRTANSIPVELERLVLACLAKDPAARPDSAVELQRALSRLAIYRDWDERAADEWWRAFDASHALTGCDPPGSTVTLQVPHTITIDVSGRTEDVGSDGMRSAS